MKKFNITLHYGAGVRTVSIVEPSGTTVIDRNGLKPSQDHRLRFMLRELYEVSR